MYFLLQVIADPYAKSVRIRSFSGPYFPTFGLNMERYEVSFRIQFECRKLRTRKPPNTNTSQAVDFITLTLFVPVLPCLSKLSDIL